MLLYVITEIFLIVIGGCMWYIYRNEYNKLYERVEAKKKVWESLITNSSLPIVVVDNDLNRRKGLKIQLASEGFRRLFNLEDRYIIGKSYLTVFPNIPQTWYQDYVKSFTLRKHIEITEPEPFDYNEILYHLIWSVSVWGSDGKVEGLVIQFIDYTEQKKHEDKLRFLIEQNSTILSLLGHQINSRVRELYQLTNIQEYADVDDSCKNKSKLISKNYEEIRAICKAVKDLTKTTTSITSLQRKEEFKDINLYNLLKDALKEVRITNYSLPEFDVKITGNACLIKEALVELLINSKKNKHPDRELFIEFSYCLIGKRTKDFVLNILDNGIGIEESKLDYIFTPFYKINPDIEGTGLGLTLVKQILIKHDASINITSKFGEYTEISLTFKAKVN